MALISSVMMLLAAGGYVYSQQHRHDLHGDTVHVKVLSEKDIAEKLNGKEARVSVLEVTMDPLHQTPPHRHPGAVFGYVLEGEFESQIEGEPLRKLKTGETFYEPTMALHVISRNPDKAARNRFVAVIVHPRDVKELVILEKNSKK